MNRLLIIQTLVLFMLSSAFAGINSTNINTNITIDDIKNSLPEGVSLPPELEGVPLPSIDEAKDVFKQKCIKVSGSDAAYEEASQASGTLVECMTSIVNVSALTSEIEQAKPNGNLDTVFNKYCNRRQEAITCVETFTTSIDPCLTQEERDQKVVFVNITKNLLEFVCHENGNQIALFIAEEGPECFSSQQDALRDCINGTMGKYFTGDMPTIDNLPTLVIKEENCKDMNKLEKCVVQQLETCRESTPANLVESMFRFVRKETPCAKFEKTKGNGKSAGDGAKFSMNVLIGTWLMAFVAKFLVSYQ